MSWTRSEEDNTACVAVPLGFDGAFEPPRREARLGFLARFRPISPPDDSAECGRCHLCPRLDRTGDLVNRRCLNDVPHRLLLKRGRLLRRFRRLRAGRLCPRSLDGRSLCHEFPRPRTSLGNFIDTAKPCPALKSAAGFMPITIPSPPPDPALRSCAAEFASPPTLQALTALGRRKPSCAARMRARLRQR